MVRFARIMAILAVAAAGVEAGEIVTAEWQPGNGVAATLIDGSSVSIDTAITKGKVEVVVDFATPVATAVIAYALNTYEEDVWYESGTTRYFTLSDEYISYEPFGGGTRVTAVIPMVNELAFLPAHDGYDQVLHVYAGVAGTMTVDPEDGVTNEEDHAEYAVETSLPALTIVPDDDHHFDGVLAAKTVTMWIVRGSAPSSDETFSLSFDGPDGLLDALELPTSATILKDEHAVAVSVPFDPLQTRAYPGASVLTMTATSGSEVATVNVAFSAMLTIPFGASGFLFGIFDDDCTPTTVPAQQPPGGTKSGCGKCVGYHATPPCPEGFTAADNGTDWLWYYPYKCEWFGSCTVTTSTVTMNGVTVSVTTRNCKIPPAAVFPVTFSYQRATDGHQCCVSYAASATARVWTLPDCS
jgi:hypothetical protein